MWKYFCKTWMLFNHCKKIWTTSLTGLSLILSIFPSNIPFLKQYYLQCDTETIQVLPSPPMPGCCKERKVMCEEFHSFPPNRVLFLEWQDNLNYCTLKIYMLCTTTGLSRPSFRPNSCKKTFQDLHLRFPAHYKAFFFEDTYIFFHRQNYYPWESRKFTAP